MHEWIYTNEYQYPTEVGLVRGGDFWLCTKCRGMSSDVPAWNASYKPTPDSLLNSWDGMNTLLSCDEMMVRNIHRE